MGELKPGWTRVKFGEVVRQVKDKVDPATSGIERYVAGEHMSTNDLRIRRWGNIANSDLGPAFHMRFMPGHVLYGSRRTYLRKVAAPDFEGICSNTTFVIEANPDALLPELLPFIMCTDEFHEHSIRESKGSVNPYVNFSDLAWYSFALPPLNEQVKIASMIRSVNDLQNRLHDLSSATLNLLNSDLLHTFNAITPKKPLQSLCRAPIAYGIVQAGPDFEGGVPYVRVSEMTGRNNIRKSEMLKASPEVAAKHSRTRLDIDDLVVALRGVPGLAHIIDADMVGGNLSRGVARVSPSSEVNPRYLLWALRSPRTLAAVRQYANGWKGEDLREITIAELRTLPIQVAPRADQDIIAERFDRLHEAWASCRARQACAWSDLMSNALKILS